MTGSVRPSVAADRSGMTVGMPWGAWALAATLLLGGGTAVAGWRLVTCDQLDKAIATSEAKQAAPVKSLSQKVDTQGRQIGALTATIGNVQKVQHQDIAFREARRVVDGAIRCGSRDLECQKQLIEERERIRQLNMRRLASNPPLDPCADLLCR